MSNILNLDADFLTKYLNYLFLNNKVLNTNTVERRYEKLWEREDYKIIISQILNFLFQNNSKTKDLKYTNIVSMFFEPYPKKNSPSEKFNIDDKKLIFLSQYIENKNFEQIKFLFNSLVNNLQDELKIELTKKFLIKDKQFEHFKAIENDSRLKMWSDGVVYFQNELNYRESIKNLLKEDIALINHLKYMEILCEQSKKSIEFYKKRSFIGNH